MGSESAAEILTRVERTFERVETANRSFLLVRGEEKRKALEDVVVWGRAVTNVMQTMRTSLPSFDDWYERHQAALKNDAGMKRFYEMRSEVLKRGELRISEMTTVISTRDFHGEPPDGATHFIVCDEATGKWGWLVRGDNGEKKKILYDFPDDVEVTERYSFKPSLMSLDDITVEATAHRYVEYLRQMILELRVLVMQQPRE